MSLTATDRGSAMLAPRPATSSAIVVSDVWVNPNSSNLVARVTVTIPRWGETINACSVVRTKAGGFYVLPPGIPLLGRDGLALKDAAGKTRYSPAVVFSPATGRRFSDAVIAELRRQRPDLLDGDAR